MANQQYSNENRGMLMKNPNKTADNHPDLSGSINVDGQEFWLSAWTKESKAGNKFLSLSIKPKEAKAKPAKQKQTNDDFGNDSVPF